MARLKQGYSIVSSVNSSKIIKDSRQIKVGDKLHLTFHKGAADSKVEKFRKIKNETKIQNLIFLKP